MKTKYKNENKVSKEEQDFRKIEEEKEEGIDTPDYSDEETEYRGELMKRITNALWQREDQWAEWNDMNYFTNYVSNREAANSYIPPKKNIQDTRVVTGTTEEKEMTLLSALLNYNLEPNIEAFDKMDLPVVDLGETMEDLIRKSRQIENYEDKRPLVYKELLDQGTCFVEVSWMERFKTIKKMIDKFYNDDGKLNVKDIKWNTAVELEQCGIETRVLEGLKVYLGNIREFEMAEQPYIFTMENISYEDARQIYQGWDRWQYVPRNLVKFIYEMDNNDEYNTQETAEEMVDKVQVIKYQDKPNNEYQIFLNGVMMLPAGFPLSAISPSGEYTIAKGDISPITKFFAYSKSIPSKTKVDQEVLDEFMKLIILKTQQSFMPPMANNSNKILSNRIFFPGRITKDVDPNQIKPIMDAQGVTQSEFASFQFIKSIIDQKSVSPTFQGEATSTQQTATEILELKKQQMMKLGIALWGVMKLEKQISWLTLQGILNYWTKPIDNRINDITGKVEDIYRIVAVEGEIDGGTKGTKLIKFNEELANNITQEEIDRQAQFLSKNGKQTKITYINPKMLQTIKYNYYITIVPTEKDSSELQRVLFIQNISDALKLFPNRLNMPYVEQRFATLIGEDPNKFFVSAQETQGMEQAQMAMAGQSQINKGTAGQVGGEIGAQVAKGAQGLNKLIQE